MAGNAVKIDASTLVTRLQSLYSHWREHRDELWGSCNAFAVAIPPLGADYRLPNPLALTKSSALSKWLLGYQFPETIMVFSDKQMYFLCTPRQASVLHFVRKPAKEAVGVDVVMRFMADTDDGATQMDAILCAIEAQEIFPVLGYVASEAPKGKVLRKWSQKLNSSSLRLCDATNGLADLFAVKEPDELTNVQMAARLTASAMKHFVVPKLNKVIEKEKKVTHYALMYYTWKATLNPTDIIYSPIFQSGGNYDLALSNDDPLYHGSASVKAIFDSARIMVDLCYAPIFQSGGNFGLRPTAFSNYDNLCYDSASVIICALGFQYDRYCANVARTFLIDPNAAQIKAYEVLIKAHEAALGAVKPGSKARDVYEAALAVVEEEAPGLTANLTKSAGAGIGVELCESVLSLNEKNERILKAGMVLDVSLGFQNMQAESSKATGQNYALWLADTVILTANGCDVVTALSSKALKDVVYPFNDSEEEEEGASNLCGHGCDSKYAGNPMLGKMEMDTFSDYGRSAKRKRTEQPKNSGALSDSVRK